MARYLEVRNANPDCLLFYRMGDFYELFFDDAEVASRALGITLTKRGRHQGRDIPMCGVPARSAESYLQRLIRLGHRVAVCEQLEDAAQAKARRGSKAILRREVARIVTPGTLTEDALLNPGRANYLAALARDPLRENFFAAAWCDVSTGECGSASGDKEQVLAETARLSPSEIAAFDEILDDGEVRDLMSSIGASSARPPIPTAPPSTLARRLAEDFRVASLDGLGSFSDAELIALRILVDYVIRVQAGAPPRLSPPKRLESRRFMALDAAARANLELTRTLGGDSERSLLATLDRAVSAAGSRLLASRLASPLLDPDAISKRLDAVEAFAASGEAREGIREILASCPDAERALTRLELGRGGPRDLLAVAKALDAATRIAARLESLDAPSLAEDVAALRSDSASRSGEAIRSTLSDDPPSSPREAGIVRDGARDDLDSRRRFQREQREAIVELERDYATRSGVKSLRLRRNTALGYFIEVPLASVDSLRASPLGSDLLPRQSLTGAARFALPELLELEGRLAESSESAQAIESEVFETLRRDAVGEGEAIRGIASALARLDASSALARLAIEEGFVRPRVDDGASFLIEGGWHPTIRSALRESGSGGDFVPNDCVLRARLESEEEASEVPSLRLLTGPNMAGKSTFLRQNAIIALLAQIGSFVPARSARLGVVDALFCRVGAADDLARGRSTFMVEMLETAAILNQAGPRALVILDEIGRGTATFDGLAIARAVVEHLHDRTGCRALFATHFHELTALSDSLSGLANASLKVSEGDGETIFEYRVVEGAAARSYGIDVARMAGVPEATLRRAESLLAAMESERSPRDLGGATPAEPPAEPPATERSPPPPPPPSPSPSPIETAVREANLDEMSPREALELLYELRRKADSR